MSVTFRQRLFSRQPPTRFAFALVFIFLCSVAGGAQTAALPSRFQSWNEVDLIVPIARGADAKGKTIDKLTATFLGVARVGRSGFDLLDDRAGATFDYRLSRHFSVFSAVLYRRDELIKNVRRYETRLDAGATISETLHSFTVRDRSEFEHRFRNNRADLNLYRNRIQINYPIKQGEKELFSPFISEEGYYDFASKTFITNEFFAGITRRLNPQTSIDIAYIRADTRPTNVNGLSLNLKIKLR